MKKIIFFVSILLLMIVVSVMNVKEGLISAGPYSDNDKKLDLLNELKRLSENANKGEITNYAPYSVYFQYPYNTDMYNEKPTDALINFIKSMTSTKMSVLKTSGFFTSNVRTSLTNLVDQNKNNYDVDKRVTDNITLYTAQRTFYNKIR